MCEDFGIKIGQESHVDDAFVSDQNLKYVVLREWQTKAIEFFWKNNGNVVFEIVSGGGKTYCAIEIIKQILKQNPKFYVLIVVPKNVILERTWFPELCGNGFTMAQVGVYYGFAKEVRQITITNMQNVTNLDLSMFDFVIFDEVHNYACSERLFKVLEYPFKYKLGLSATVERIDNNHWRMLKAFDYNKFVYTPKQALRDNVLNQFNFINVAIRMDPISFEKYLELTQEINVIIQQGGGYSRILNGTAGEALRSALYKKTNERKQLVLNYPLKMNALQQICKMHEHEKTLVFNEYNKTTSMCYFELLDVGIKAKVIHSGIPKKDIDKTLNDYMRDRFNILLATKVLDEGYNLPAISVAVIQAGNSTARQTIQRLGRVLRKKDEPSMLYQIFIKDTMEEEQARTRSVLFKDLCTDYREFMFTREKGFEEG